MGRVRTKTVKKAARLLIEKYYSTLTLDFQTNKRVCDEKAIIPSKRMRNKIAGYATHLMSRIQRGPVRGISLKLQEEERERRLDFIPDQSSVAIDQIEVDPETKAMLNYLGMRNLPGITVTPSTGRKVRGISLKLQEEERERRLDFIPDQSSVAIDQIEVDPETKAMLNYLDMRNLPGITVSAIHRPEATAFNRGPLPPRR
eukprot:CAMPEP_0196666296 /NCGR_PEP_ID=MMETSP1086-20130531/64427_1 /TAXON_ID=77921 /ORGANISM="Cyanoptyche  gloeocystis , Strain SAG4.97" /LENGTH=200 /DNA_ID=CAMNT_0042003469 /DNA_START=67 /DNA_END=670 /DNA_ORIENTATION=+